jgi:hypothetical protein
VTILKSIYADLWCAFGSFLMQLAYRMFRRKAIGKRRALPFSKLFTTTITYTGAGSPHRTVGGLND